MRDCFLNIIYENIILNNAPELNASICVTFEWISI